MKNNDSEMLRTELLAEIASAARQQDSAKIYDATERLRRFESLMQEAYSLARPQKPSFEPNGNVSPSIKNLAHETSSDTNTVKERRARGERIRAEWINQISKLGKALMPIRGALYRNTQGDVVGIACASERKHPNGVWWLGLPDGKFHRAALLCVPSNGKVFAVCLPRNFIDSYSHLLSKSNVGQRQFTIIKRAEKFYLRLKSNDPIEITSYIDKYSNVA
jgi:hypothetical protein